ncbi:hypothetical protein [Rhodanobacter sp. C03]|uniref:hypothetical protein n=1 Tax=Rhodanobacter sp. C03 TaxID=1945858 RepID=UPI001C2BF740|nr:hypothetical protein [Rhodanobacter sp. C03]
MVISKRANVTGYGVRRRLDELCYIGRLPDVLVRTYSKMFQVRTLTCHRVPPVNDRDAFDFELDMIKTIGDGFREHIQLLQRHFSGIESGGALAMLAGCHHTAGGYIGHGRPQFASGRDALYRIPVERVMGACWRTATPRLSELRSYLGASRTDTLGPDPACSY